MFVVLLVLHLIFVRKTRIVVDLIAVYTSFLIVVFLPMIMTTVAEWLNAISFGRMILFIALVILFHIIFWKSNLGIFSRHIAVLDFAVSVLYRFAIVGLFMATTLFFSPPILKEQLGDLSSLLFASLGALAFWFFIPLLLAFSYRFKAKNGWIE
jgi:hypothetical protein